MMDLLLLLLVILDKKPLVLLVTDKRLSLCCLSLEIGWLSCPRDYLTVAATFFSKFTPVCYVDLIPFKLKLSNPKVFI